MDGKPGERELPQAPPAGLAVAPLSQAAEGAFEALRKDDLQCAICLDLLVDPFVTACGAPTAAAAAAAACVAAPLLLCPATPSCLMRMRSTTTLRRPHLLLPLPG